MNELRGKCREMAVAAVTEDPSLSLVRGWYDDPIWGAQEHWWTTRLDGSIHDPTSSQFPCGGVTEWYRPFTGTFPCEECGSDVDEGDLVEGRCCSYRCFGRLVGVPIDNERFPSGQETS